MSKRVDIVVVGGGSSLYAVLDGGEKVHVGCAIHEKPEELSTTTLFFSHAIRHTLFSN